MKRTMKNRKGGFTLMELIIAILFMSIIVIGLLSTVGYAFDILATSDGYMIDVYNSQSNAETELLDMSTTGSTVNFSWSWIDAGTTSTTGATVNYNANENYLDETIHILNPGPYRLPTDSSSD